jgi:alpha-ketoglutarate-dependent taurine dioxygenase
MTIDLSFGITLNQSANDLSQDDIRDLISKHGCILFRGYALSHAEQEAVLKKLGTIQNFSQQQAPVTAVDNKNLNVILLHNNDFLGTSRMGWHTDQTYNPETYLPIRSLYCTSVSAPNITELADVAYLTDKIIEKFGITSTTFARYYIDMKKQKYTDRSVLAHCQHIGRPLFRFDNRMEFIDRTDSQQIKNFCRSILDREEIPKIKVQWQENDFLIFDNNRCPHRRSLMNGECKLSRITCSIWCASR